METLQRAFSQFDGKSQTCRKIEVKLKKQHLSTFFTHTLAASIAPTLKWSLVRRLPLPQDSKEWR